MVLDASQNVLNYQPEAGGGTTVITPVAPRDPDRRVNFLRLNPQLQAQADWLTSRGYQFQVTDTGGLLVTSAPADESSLLLLFSAMEYQPRFCPPHVPEARCRRLRQSFEAEVALLQESEDCSDCEQGKVTRKYLEIAKAEFDTLKAKTFSQPPV